MFSSAATLLSVPPDDEPNSLTRYTIHLIDEWERSGKLLEDLATLASLAASNPSGIRAGSFDVGAKSWRGYAKAFKMTPTEYAQAADDWAASNGAEAIPLAENVSEAMTQLRRAALALSDDEEKKVLDQIRRLNTEDMLPHEIVPSMMSILQRDRRVAAEARQKKRGQAEAARGRIKAKASAGMEWEEQQKKHGRHPGQNAALASVEKKRAEETAAAKTEEAPPAPRATAESKKRR